MCVLMMHKKTICGKRVGFPFFIEKKNTEVIFPQAQWKVRVRETDSLSKYLEKDDRQDMICTTLLFQFYNLLS